MKFNYSYKLNDGRTDSTFESILEETFPEQGKKK